MSYEASRGGIVNPQSPTVYILDDDADIGRAVGRLLRSAGYRPVVFQTAEDFLRDYDPSAPGCLILDYRMPELDGLEVQMLLKQSGSTHPILFLTGLGTIPLTVDAVKGGALNVLTKPVDEVTLLRAIEEAIDVDRGRRSEQKRSGVLLERYATLTAREREVMAHVVKGRLNKQIAADLGTVEKTIKVHRARAMTKMGATSLAEFVRLALSVEQEQMARSVAHNERLQVDAAQRHTATGFCRIGGLCVPKPHAFHAALLESRADAERESDGTNSSAECERDACHAPVAQE
jgi:two-component system, LuxR family, response regulator FixJ